MPRFRTVALAGAAIVLFAGAAVAATAGFHTMSVNLPDGSVAHIRYAGDVAPRVAIEAADARQAAMMRRMAAAQAQAAAAGQGGEPGRFVVTGAMPAGSSYRYTMVSTSNGKGSCTQTVEWRSDGAGRQPQVTRASSGDCDAVKSGEGDKAVPVSATAKAPPVDPRSI
ncbi:MAG: hypothetical protein LBV50_00925 [Novosphingobium sp.]|jgi:hypothetical protein|nr:hypothetical protein [Novosphingobium sp.]